MILYHTIYLITINIVAISLFRIDKYNARRKKQRISEKTLFIVAIVGGTIGSIAGMYVGENHKTNKWQFKFGLPALLLGQLLVYKTLLDYLNIII